MWDVGEQRLQRGLELLAALQSVWQRLGQLRLVGPCLCVRLALLADAGLDLPLPLGPVGLNFAIHGLQTGLVVLVRHAVLGDVEEPRLAQLVRATLLPEPCLRESQGGCNQTIAVLVPVDRRARLEEPDGFTRVPHVGLHIDQRDVGVGRVGRVRGRLGVGLGRVVGHQRGGESLHERSTTRAGVVHLGVRERIQRRVRRHERAVFRRGWRCRSPWRLRRRVALHGLQDALQLGVFLLPYLAVVDAELGEDVRRRIIGLAGEPGQVVLRHGLKVRIDVVEEGRSGYLRRLLRRPRASGAARRDVAWDRVHRLSVVPVGIRKVLVHIVRMRGVRPNLAHRLALGQKAALGIRWRVPTEGRGVVKRVAPQINDAGAGDERRLLRHRFRPRLVRIVHHTQLHT